MSTEALIQMAQAAGVSLRLEDGKVKATGTKAAVAALIEPLRKHKAELVLWFEQKAIPREVLVEEYRLYTRLIPSASPPPEPKADPGTWRELAQAYHAHHFKCKTCCAAGQGRGQRCGAGAALWTSYQSTN